MSLSGNKSRIIALTKDLSVKWENTRTHWSDARSREFDERFMQELMQRTEKAVTMIDKLDELLRKVRKDCE